MKNMTASLFKSSESFIVIKVSLNQKFSKRKFTRIEEMFFFKLEVSNGSCERLLININDFCCSLVLCIISIRVTHVSCRSSLQEFKSCLIKEYDNHFFKLFIIF